MKKILFLLMLIPVLAFSQTIALVSETNYGNDKEFYFYAASCDSGTTTSAIINLDKYNSTTNQVSFYIYVAENSSAYNPILGVYLEGKNSLGTWVNVDTLYVTDTVSSNVTASGMIDLHASTVGLFPQYRLKTVATSGLGKTFSIKASLFAIKQD